MFCNKCGKPNDEDALFCEFCGAPIIRQAQNADAEISSAPPPVEQPAAVQVQPTAAPTMQSPAVPPMQPPTAPPMQQPTAPPMQPMYAQPPMGAPMQAAGAAVPKKRSNAGKIVAIAISAAVVITAAVILFLLWKKQSAEKLTMTVNGKNIPVDTTLYTSYVYDDDDPEHFYVLFCGKTEDEAYICMVHFPEMPTSDMDYVITGDDSDDVYYNFWYSTNDTEVKRGFHDFDLTYPDIEVNPRQISVVKCDPYEYINISVEGPTEDDFNIKISGKIDYRKFDAVNELDDFFNTWKDNNMIPASGSDESAPDPSQQEQPSQPDTLKEIEIKGQKYSTDLTFLDLSGKDLNDWDIQDLKYMTNLERIELSDNNLGDISILQNIPTLVEIDADNNSISNISFLSKLSNIKIVVMNNNRISDISVFEKIPAVQKIWMNDNLITDISPIANCTNLTELGFNNCNIQDISMLNRMTRLQLLCLYNCGISDISALASCMSLKELHIGGNPINDYSPLYKIGFDEASAV